MAYLLFEDDIWFLSIQSNPNSLELNLQQPSLIISPAIEIRSEWFHLSRLSRKAETYLVASSMICKGENRISMGSRLRSGCKTGAYKNQICRLGSKDGSLSFSFTPELVSEKETHLGHRDDLPSSSSTTRCTFNNSREIQKLNLGAIDIQDCRSVDQQVRFNVSHFSVEALQ